MAITNRSSSYQPVASGGVFDFLGRLFVATPTYRGEAQPRPAPSAGLIARLLGLTAPAYKAAPPMPTPDENAEPDTPSDTDSSTDSAPGPLPGCDGTPLTIVIARD